MSATWSYKASKFNFTSYRNFLVCHFSVKLRNFRKIWTAPWPLPVCQNGFICFRNIIICKKEPVSSLENVCRHSDIEKTKKSRCIKRNKKRTQKKLWLRSFQKLWTAPQPRPAGINGLICFRNVKICKKSWSRPRPGASQFYYISPYQILIGGQIAIWPSVGGGKSK